MHAIVVDRRVPAPWLIAKAERAIGAGVRSTGAPSWYACATTATIARARSVALAALLDSLPTTVGPRPSAGAAVSVDTTPRAITALRTASAVELAFGGSGDGACLPPLRDSAALINLSRSRLRLTDRIKLCGGDIA